MHATSQVLTHRWGEVYLRDDPACPHAGGELVPPHPCPAWETGHSWLPWRRCSPVGYREGDRRSPIPDTRFLARSATDRASPAVGVRAATCTGWSIGSAGRQMAQMDEYAHSSVGAAVARAVPRGSITGTVVTGADDDDAARWREGGTIALREPNGGVGRTRLQTPAPRIPAPCDLQ